MASRVVVVTHKKDTFYRNCLDTLLIASPFLRVQFWTIAGARSCQGQPTRCHGAIVCFSVITKVTTRHDEYEVKHSPGAGVG